MRDQLAPYLWHRDHGRPYVVAKVAAHPRRRRGDGRRHEPVDHRLSQRARDAHVLRAQSQAIVVGAGTVRADDPRSTARLDDIVLEPLRVVLGHAPVDARVRALSRARAAISAELLDELGQLDVLQVLVEGGPTTTSAFLDAGLVNRLVWYEAPALAGGDGTLGALRTLTTPTIGALRRGRVVDVRRIGEDIRIDVEV